tara:strand:+ start:1613 stop:2062 length:450 start_codon:yes stop_codon:yes gene_type:complete
MSGSSNTVVSATSNQQIVNYNTEKLIIRSTRFIDAQYENLTAGDVELLCGMLVGRITATGKIVPLVSSAVDGSEIPLGVIITTETVAAGAVIDISVCVKGELDKSLVLIDAGDTLETVIDGRRLEDRILGDTLGVLLVDVEQLTDFDNQ